jgi:osmoprotectant transport system permease protein
MTPGRLVTVAALLLLVGFLALPTAFAPLFTPFTKNGQPAIYTQAAIGMLAVHHLALVLIATASGSVVALGIAIFVTRPSGREFLPLARTIANIGQTFPPVAVLALAVPILGFGAEPTLVALFLYGLLPIFENALAGLTGIAPATIEAARGAGMTETQKLLRVELPLALPTILTGIRISTVIAIGTATIGSTVAASTLGEVIIAGLINSNLAFVLQGAVVVGALAMLLNGLLLWLERRLVRGRAG